MDTTLVKGLALLEALARSDRPRGVTDVAAELGFGKSRVHRFLQTLIQVGYVRKNPSDARYECTLKIWELGSAVMERFDIRAAARPCMEALAAKSAETVHLSVLDGVDTMHIDKIDSPHPVRAYSRIGGRVPSYCVATGKALLAFAPESTVTAVCGSLKRHTSKTIADIDEFLRELEKIRQTGYAINRGEWRESVVGIAAPILDERGGAVAALGISGPVERLNMNRLRDFVPLVLKAGRSTARAVGLTGRAFRPPAAWVQA